MTKNRSTMLLAGVAALFAASRLHAQQTGAATGASTEQAVQLSEFDVSAESTHGYVASETMSAARVNTKIIDLPYSVVNLTSEFFDDFGIDVLDENMTYLGGLTGLNIGGSFNIRGFSATSQLRDGFYRLGRYGKTNVDRIEIIRGNEAGIYGRSSPGGMVNMISKQPKKFEQEKLTLRDGGYGQHTVDLEATGPITKTGKTYYILTLGQVERRYDGQYGHIRNNEVYGAVRHDFSDNSHLQVQAEYFMQIQHSGAQSSAPVISIARTADTVPTGTIDPTKNIAVATALGYDTALAKYNPFGPVSQLNRGSSTFVAEYDKEFNDVFSMRISSQRFAARRWDYNNNGWAGITIPATGVLTGLTDTRSSTPTFGRIMEDGGGSQSDFVAHYGLFNHEVDNKTLLTVDYNDYYRWDPTMNFSAVPANSPEIINWNAAGSGRVVNLNPVVINGKTQFIPVPGPIAYFTTPFDWSRSPSINSLTRRRTVSMGGNLSQQSFFFDKRLIVYAGLRVDNVLFSQRDYTVQFASVGVENLAPGTGGKGQVGGSVVRRYFHQRRPNTGFNYKINDHIHVYGSYSESYFVDQTNRPAVIASTGFQPQIAKGYDYGVKGSFFDEKLNFTLGGYYANQYNVAVSDQVETPPGSGVFIASTLNDGNQQDKGAEFDLSWLVTDDLTLQLSGAVVNAKYMNFGTAFPEAKGRSVQNQTPENGSIIVKYNFSNGPLKGLDVESLLTYISSTPSESPNSGDTTAFSPTLGKWVVTGHTDQWKLRVPSFTLWQIGAHYRLPRLAAGWDQTIGVNLNNALNRTNFLKTSKLYADERNVVFTYTISHSGSR